MDEFKLPIQFAETLETEDDSNKKLISYTRPKYWTKRVSFSTPENAISVDAANNQRLDFLYSKRNQRILKDSQSTKNYGNYRIIEMDSDDDDDETLTNKNFLGIDFNNLKKKSLLGEESITKNQSLSNEEQQPNPDKLRIEKLEEILQKERDSFTGAYKNMTKDFDNVIKKAKYFLDRYDSDENIITERFNSIKDQIKNMQNVIQTSFRKDFDDLMKSFYEVERPQPLKVPPMQWDENYNNNNDNNNNNNQENMIMLTELEPESNARCL